MSYEQPSTEEERLLWKELEKIIDPELHADIVHLGLIYSVSLSEQTAQVTMTFTTPLCPFGGMLLNNVQEAVRIFGFIPKIEVTFEPPWSLEKVHPSIREQFMFPLDEEF